LPNSRTTLAAVEFHEVRKAFGGRPVLDGFTLTVEAGETIALIGPSGCGKTTALKLVNRLLDPDGGRVLVEGRDVALEDAIALRRKLGYVIQEGGIFPHWDVRANVEVVPRMLGWEDERRRRRAAEVLAMVNLPVEEFGPRRPRQLSGGQRQRVGVARALAADPPVLLMDEPFGALDPIARRALQREFLEWKGRLKKAVLLVTHDMREAFLLADRIAVMDRGRLRQIGTRADLVERPADDFVREFVSEAS
jgi:osmoprotectant transport system ATP-binding protein